MEIGKIGAIAFALVLMLQVGVASAQSAVDPTGARAGCMSIPTCIAEYEVYFSHYDSNGCAIYGCREAIMDSDVAVSISVQPQQVDLYGSFQVYGKVFYDSHPNPAADSVSNQKKFKVVTSYSDYDYASLSAKKGKISLASSPSVVDTIFGIFSSKGQQDNGQAAKKAGQQPNSQIVAQQAEANKQESKAYRASDNAKEVAASVSSVAASNQSANSQERIDYIVLSPGETAEVSAYFTAQTPGTKLARITVYSQEASCPINPYIDQACKLVEKQVAQASAKVNVNREAPPQPPQDKPYGTIALRSGWNMVSVPVNSKISMVEVAGACGTASQAWRLAESGYVKEDTLVPGYGYWVKGTKDCKYEVKGESRVRSLEPLNAGWNLIGSLGTAAQFSDLSSGCSVSSGPWHYNTEQKQYEYSSSLQPGKAYWVKVGGACKLGFSYEDQPPAPPQ